MVATFAIVDLHLRVCVSHPTVAIGFVSDHFQNALAFEAGDALCVSLCGAMSLVMLGTLCYWLALSSFVRNEHDKKCADDPNFRAFLGDV